MLRRKARQSQYFACCPACQEQLGVVQKLQSSQSLHVDLAPEQFLGTVKREMMMITLITLATVTTIIIICRFFQPGLSTLDENR